MATRTISDTGGNWNATETWVEGAVPTNADAVVATATSGPVTITAAAVCQSIDMSLYTNTLTHNAFTLTVGDNTNAPTLNFSGSWNYTAIGATSAIILTCFSSINVYITFGGKTFGNFTVTSGGNGVAYQIQDDLTTLPTAYFTLARGNLYTNDHNFNVGKFLDNAGSYTHRIDLGSSTITTAFSSAIAFQMTTTNLTLTANTATIIMNGNSATFAGGNQTFGGSVTFNGSGTNIITGANTIANLTVNGTANKTDVFSIGGNQAVTNFSLISNSAINRLLVKSDTLGTQRTITAANVTVSDVDFLDIIGAGAGNWNLSANNTGDCTNNSGITFTSPTTQHWINSNGGNYSDVANWTSRIPLPQDSCIFDCAFGSAKSVYADMSRMGSIDFTGATWTTSLTLRPSSPVTFYGSFTLIANLSYTRPDIVYFWSTGNSTINSFGIIICSSTCSMYGNYTLLDDFSVNVYSPTWLNLYYGTLDIQGFSCSIQRFQGINNGLAKAIKSTINGKIIHKTTYAFSVDINDCDTSQFLGEWTMSKIVTSATLNFSGKGLPNGTLYMIGDAGDTGNPVISGNNAFKELKFDLTAAGKTVLFNSGSTQNIGTFTSNASAGKTLTLGRSGTNKPTLHYAGNAPIRTDYISTSNINFSPINTWFTGANYTDGGGNLNIGFNTDFPAAPTLTEARPFRISVTRTSKPPIGTKLDWTNQFTQKLAGGGVWVFNEQGGKLAYNEIGDNHLALGTNAELNFIGLRMTGNGTGNAITSPIDLGSNYTLHVVGAARSNAAGRIAVSNGLTTGVLGSNWSGYPFMTISGTTYVYANPLQYNIPASFSFIANDNNAPGHKYFNSKKEANTASITNPSFILSHIGDDSNNSPWIDGDLGAIFAFPVSLTSEEMITFIDNPWQIYEPEIVWMTLEEAIAGGYYLSINNVVKQPSSYHALINNSVKDLTGYTLINGNINQI